MLALSTFLGLFIIFFTLFFYMSPLLSCPTLLLLSLSLLFLFDLGLLFHLSQTLQKALLRVKRLNIHICKLEINAKSCQTQKSENQCLF